MSLENGESRLGTEAEIERWLGCIRNVGPAKPVGNLPLPTITEYCKSDVQVLVAESEAKGLKAKILNHPGMQWDRNDHRVLYVYDEVALQALLDKDRVILTEAGWPTEAEKFVTNLYFRRAKEGTALYKLIARAFGDKAGENL